MPLAIAEKLIATTADLTTSQEDAQKLAGQLLEASSTASQEDVQAALKLLGEAVVAQETSRAGFLAVVCGALIEHGHDAAVAEESIMNFTLDLIDKASIIHEACHQSVPQLAQKEEDVEEGFDRYKVFGETMDKLESTMPKNFEAWHVLAMAWRPAIVMMSESRAAREMAKRVQPRVKLMSDFAEAGHWIDMILNVLDDEPLLVLEPSTGLGFRGTMSGIVDNFQLNMILMDQFPSTDDVSRISPAAAEIARGIGPQSSDDSVTGTWNLCTHHALQEDGSVSEETETWIWNEGTPADIPIFDGHRTVLLAPASYPRTWGAQRMFDRLAAEVKVEQEFTKDEVAELLARMGK